jgi:hypothetical protein
MSLDQPEPKQMNTFVSASLAFSALKMEWPGPTIIMFSSHERLLLSTQHLFFFCSPRWLVQVGGHSGFGRQMPPVDQKVPVQND